MNSLIVYPEEGWYEGCVTLLGDRARAARASASCKVGSELHLALFGGEKGIARVRDSSDQKIVLDLVLIKPSLSLRPIDLIVGLSRPQTTKKVIQAAVMSGVRSLHLVHLNSGEKSYLDAHILQDVQLQQEIVKSLEQIWEGLYPEISVHRHFDAFIRKHERCSLRGVDELKVVAHPGAETLSNSAIKSTSRAVIAVGSEGGWSKQELDALSCVGFRQVGLGERIVRVEVALLYLLGQTMGIS